MPEVILFQPSNNRRFVSTPYGLVSLASMLRKHRISCEIVDLRVAEYSKQSSYDNLLDKVLPRVPIDEARLFGVSLLSFEEARFARVLVRRLKELNKRASIVMGGYFTTSMYTRMFELYPEIDGFFLGESELTLLRLARESSKSRMSSEDGIQGYVGRQRGGDFQREVKPCVPSFKDLAPIDYSVLGQIDRYSVFLYEISRGCPFSCTHCLESRVTSRNYRMKELDILDQELTNLNQCLPKKYIFLSDCLIAANSRWEEVFNRMAPHGFRFLAEGRADTSPRLIPPAHKAGLRVLWVGLESGSYNTLRRLGKVRDRGSYSRYLHGCQQLVKSLVENDITPGISLMIGIPGDGHEDFIRTVEYVEQLKETAEEAMIRTGKNPGMYVATNRFILFEGCDLFARYGKSLESGVEVESTNEDYGAFRVLKPRADIEEEDLHEFTDSLERLTLHSRIMKERFLRLGCYGRSTPVGGK